MPRLLKPYCPEGHLKILGKCKPCHKRDEAARRTRLREAVLDKFGRQCVYCGYAGVRALQLDHINGGGTKEISKIRTPGVYVRALKEPWDFQMLYANCNWIKGGTHETE